MVVVLRLLFILDVNGEKYEDKQITIHPKEVNKKHFGIIKNGIYNVCKSGYRCFRY